MKCISLAIIAAGVVIVCGCSRPGATRSMAKQSAGDPVEHRTDEFPAAADIRERQAGWARDGWSVTIVSAPITKPDGTVVRRAELTRVRQDGGF